MDLNELQKQLQTTIATEARKLAAVKLREMALALENGNGELALAAHGIIGVVVEPEPAKKSSGLRPWSQVPEKEQKLLKGRWYPFNSSRKKRGQSKVSFESYLKERCEIDFAQ